MKELYIGLMSGTSLDGVDCVIYDFNANQLIASSYTAYSDELKQDIISLFGNTTLKNIAKLDIQLASIYADCVNTLLAQKGIAADEIIAIGNHGQTVYHAPGQYSLQLGNNTLLAQRTRIRVIGDFRSADIFAGGQGAPLTPKYHHYLLSGNGIVINLGGIANITHIDGSNIIGFDSGPANTLIDNYMLEAKGVSFDKDGMFARSGVVLTDVLDAMLDDEYFNLPYPKSTGVEYFNMSWVQRYLAGDEKPQDIVRTLTELTAVTIARHIQSDEDIYLCGGGVHNAFLCERIAYALPQHNILTTNDLGVHPNFVEAIAFAYFAKLHLENIPANVPNVTGATRETILGIQCNG